MGGLSQARQVRSRIHERTISLRFLGIILRVHSFEVSVYNVYNTKRYNLKGDGGGGGRIPAIRGDCDCKEENPEDFCPNSVKKFGLRTVFVFYLG